MNIFEQAEEYFSKRRIEEEVTNKTINELTDSLIIAEKQLIVQVLHSFPYFREQIKPDEYLSLMAWSESPNRSISNLKVTYDSAKKQYWLELENGKIGDLPTIIKSWEDFKKQIEYGNIKIA